jgi:hypothetical protein
MRNSVASTNDPIPRDEFARHVPLVAGAVVLVVAVPLGVVRGAPSVVLWVAFALLAAAVLLFWEALRTALDPAAPGDDADLDEEGVPTDLEAVKKAALKGLKDIEFERSIGRLSEEDHKELEQKYRAEARAAMRAIDEGLGQWLPRAEALLDEVAGGAVAPVEKPAATPEKEPQEESPKEAVVAEAKTVACPKCETANDTDAVFCKKCGTRVAAEVTDAP